MQEWTVKHMMNAAECSHETQQYCTQAGGLFCSNGNVKVPRDAEEARGHVLL